jgi:hypothetical protein
VTGPIGLASATFGGTLTLSATGTITADASGSGITGTGVGIAGAITITSSAGDIVLDEPLVSGGADCVSENISTLMGEGYPREQAIAIAISVCEGKAWKDADPAKALADVDTKPTDEMADLARRGLELRSEYGRGGTAVGVARARDIGNRANLSPETVRRMHAYFSRHRIYLDAEGAKPGEDGYPSAGAIAWMLWGGDPSNADGAGAGWAARKVEELDAAQERKSVRSAVLDVVREMDRDGFTGDDAEIMGDEQHRHAQPLLEIAQQLARLGVAVIEAGFPISSPGDLEGVQAVAREVEGPTIAGLARANEKDIAVAWEGVRDAARPRIHTFIATSDIHMAHKLRMDRATVLATATDAVRRETAAH